MSNTPTRKARAQADRQAREQERQAQQRRQRLLLAAGGAVVLLLAVGIGVLSAGESAEREDVPTVEDVAGDPTIEGEGFPPAPEDPADDAVVGESAPVVRGADFDGTEVTIGDPGQPQVIAFMASWCPACDEELPQVVDWVEAGGLPEGVELVSVATNHDRARPNWPPQDWYAEAGFDRPILVDDEESSVAGAFGLTATPFWVAIDEDGQAVGRLTGMIGAEQMTALAEAAAG